MARSIADPILSENSGMMLPSSLTSRPSAIVSPATRSPRMSACEARILISIVGVGSSTIESAGPGVTTPGPVSGMPQPQTAA
jgi:hypothetical protein